MPNSQEQEVPPKFRFKKWLFPFLEAALVIGFFIFVANISANPYSLPSSVAASQPLQYTCYTPGGCPAAQPTATPIPPTPTPLPEPTATPLPPEPPEVPGTISVVPGQAQPGAVVTVRGRNWIAKLRDGSPNKVTLVLDNGTSAVTGGISGFSVSANAPVATLGTYQVGVDGSFEGSATVPNINSLKGQIIATDLRGNSVATAFSIQAQASTSCPSVSLGQGLQIATNIGQAGDTYAVCIVAVAGEDGVNLNDTIIINLPAGASVASQAASVGSVSMSQNSVRWGGFSLAPRQNAVLTLSINNGTANLAGNSNMLISGRFNQGLSFQQRYPTMPPLIQIGGQGGGLAPGDVPTSGLGYQNQAAATTPTGWLVGLGITVILVALLGLGVQALSKKRRH